MRVRKQYQATVYTLEQAAWNSLDRGSYLSHGQWERLENKADELVTFVSRLFELLVNKGVLTHQEALGLIEGYEEVSEVERTRQNAS